MPMTRQFIDISGQRIAYTECGVPDGKPMLFIHGNPTSSFLWRNVMPWVADKVHCIAPDLMGMGDSDKLPAAGPGSYRLHHHQTIIDGLIDQLGIGDDLTLVLHDWGTALGFDWARRHPYSVKGLCYMEGFVMPLGWDDWPEAIRDLFQDLRSEPGEKLILNDNFFVEKILPGSILRDLTDDEMGIYRRPYTTPGEDRRPTLSWPRELPLDGEPADVVATIQQYAAWLVQSDTPKLFVNAEPGAVLVGRQREFCRNFPNQTEVTVPGIHFIQEDSPDEIGQAIRDWYLKIT